MTATASTSVQEDPAPTVEPGVDQAGEVVERCWGCGHRHEPGAPGKCWEAACHASCRESPDCPLPYTPDEPTAGARR